VSIFIVCLKKRKFNQVEISHICKKLEENLPEKLKCIETDTKSFMSIMESAIKEISANCQRKLKKVHLHGWNDEIQKLVQERRKAKRYLQRQFSTQLYIQYKELDAKVKNRIMNLKRDTWRKFCESKLNKDTPIKKMWATFNTLTRKFKEKANKPIQDPHTGQITNDPKTIANILAAVLVNKREQLPSYSTEENNNMKKQIEVAVKEKGDYDKDFDIEELYHVINKLPKNKSPGLDGITNDVIKEMGPKSKDFLCHLYNMCLAKARLPRAWDTSLIVPILKQGRNSLIPDNYRPISLTTVFRKTLEHLIKHRIEEKIDKALSRRQVGFRKKRSTIDAVVKLENEIKIGMQEKNSVYAIFYDLTSAFDSVPLQLVAQKLSMHIKGKMLDLIISLTKIEETYVAIKNVISDKIQFTKGVPQGCVLSPLLFNLVLADFPFKNVDGQIFADDIGSWAKGRTPEEAQKTIKISVIEAVNWAKLNKMVFSNKTVAMIFNANKRNDLQRLEIDVDSLHIPLVNHTRNLGVSIDLKLNMKLHINNILRETSNIINLLKCLAGKNWGADRSILKLFYTAAIRSKIEYAAPLMAEMCDNNYYQLEKIQNQALRIITGGMRTTPIPALRMETRIMSLKGRIQQPAIKYILKISDEVNHPNQKIIQLHTSKAWKFIPWN